MRTVCSFASGAPWLRALAAIGLAAGCGRIDVDAINARCTDDAGACMSTPAPPSSARCGDGVCGGGELCSTCSDCRTTQPACGNGACDPGEDSSNCLTDCGPSPWPWAGIEQDALTQINDFRGSDAGCPNGPTLVNGALAEDPSLRAAAREWAWEVAHQGFMSADGSRCNGRTLGQLETATGVSYVHVVTGFATANDMMQAWEMDPVACRDLLLMGHSGMEVGVAMDAERAFVVLFK